MHSTPLDGAIHAWSENYGRLAASLKKAGYVEGVGFKRQGYRIIFLNPDCYNYAIANLLQDLICFQFSSGFLCGMQFDQKPDNPDLWFERGYEKAQYTLRQEETWLLLTSSN